MSKVRTQIFLEKNQKEILEKLLSVTGICKGGPKDLADKHDKYLYGASKKRRQNISKK